MSETILQVTNLVKKIKGKTILDHISFEVGQGDCLALIGPNGAGKTTLMSCILGDKKASSGQVFIKGKKGESARSNCGPSPRKYHSLAIESQGTDCFFPRYF